MSHNLSNLKWLMLQFYFLFAMALDHPKTLCTNIEAQKDVNFSLLKGDWVGVESVIFVDGQPTNPANVSQDIRSSLCLYSRRSDLTEDGLVATTDIHIPGRDMFVEISTLTPLDSKRSRFDWEFVLIASDPDKYMVYLLCTPPNEAGERLPERVNLVSRHTSHGDHKVMTEDDIRDVETKIATELGLAGRGITPVKNNSTCWSSYINNTAIRLTMNSLYVICISLALLYISEFM